MNKIATIFQVVSSVCFVIMASICVFATDGPTNKDIAVLICSAVSMWLASTLGKDDV